MSGVFSALSLFEIAPRDFAVIPFDAAARAAARNVILAVCVGIFLASLYGIYQHAVPGGIVRALLAADALDEERAKSLSALGLTNPFYRYEAAHNAMLKRFLTLAPTKNGEEPRYFIKEEDKYSADARFEKEKNPYLAVIFSALFSFLLAILLIKFLPFVLSIADRILQ